MFTLDGNKQVPAWWFVPSLFVAIARHEPPWAPIDDK